jgi:predicted MFS family arabinose efflux permease
MPIVTMSLPVNVFLAALFSQGLHLPKPTIGFICALPFACNFLQIFISPFLARWFTPKLIAAVTASIHAMCWVGLAVVLRALPRDDVATAGRWIAIWFFVTSIFGAVNGVAWNEWVQGWVPARLRGKYFSRRNRLLAFSTITFLLTNGWVLDRWEYSVPAFQAMIIGAVLLRLGSVYWIWTTPADEDPEARRRGPTFASQLQRVRQSRSLLVFIAFGAVWSFAANAFGPFYHVFMFEQLELSATQIGLTAVLSALGGALSLPAWGPLLDRFGNKSVMAVSLLLWQVQNYLWCVLTPETRQLAYAMWFWGGMTSAGFVLGQFTMLLKLIPIEAKSLAIGCNLAITSLVAAIAPVLGGEVLGEALTRWPERTLDIYHACFLVQPTIAILGATLLLRVREPAAQPLTNVVGAMRNIRTLSGIFGLSFLVNYVFYRPRRP